MHRQNKYTTHNEEGGHDDEKNYDHKNFVLMNEILHSKICCEHDRRFSSIDVRCGISTSRLLVLVLVHIYTIFLQRITVDKFN
jgi:hypothetical protein